MLKVNHKKRVKKEPKIKWWKLKSKECGETFKMEVRQALKGTEELPDDWETIADLVRKQQQQQQTF